MNKTGIQRIVAERKRQISKEGWDEEHDDEHTEGELALAAVCYATPTPLFTMEKRKGTIMFYDPWPTTWDEEWDKRPYLEDEYGNRGELATPTRKERIRQLEKAGALIAAEIDRLLRFKKED